MGKEYQVQFTYEYDPNAAELYDIQVSSDKKIDIFLNLKHTFASRFLQPRMKEMDLQFSLPILLYVVHLAYKEGVKEISMIRNRINEICQNILLEHDYLA